MRKGQISSENNWSFFPLHCWSKDI
jgi:hypothetical protein